MLDLRQDICIMGSTMNKRDKPTKEMEAMLKMRLAGMTYKAIGDIFGYSKQYVHQIWQRWGPNQSASANGKPPLDTPPLG